MVRVLVCGDPGHNFVKISQKLSALNKKSGPFQFAVLLSPPAALPETFSSSLPTYFASHDYEDSSIPRQVRPNVFYVGPSSNLRIHNLNMVLIAAGYDDPKSPALPPEVESALHRAGVAGAHFRGIDLLISPDLPRGVEIDKEKSAHSGLVAQVALRLRPRYHFASSSDYVALPAFSCAGADHGTRLLAIARSDAPKRDGKAPKWVYAADVTPLEMMTPAQRAETAPQVAMRAPYVGVTPQTGKLHAAAARITREVMTDGNDNQFFWNVRGRGHKRQRGGRLPARRRKARRASVATPVDAACWFCLSNEKDTHLVVDVGEHMYLAMAKGGVNDDHLLIVPIDHVRSSVDGRLSEDMANELEMYKKGIAAYFERSLDGANAYFFERAVATRGGAKQMHMHVNAIPIQKAICRRVLENAEAAAERFAIVLRKLNQGETKSTPTAASQEKVTPKQGKEAVEPGSDAIDAERTPGGDATDVIPEKEKAPEHVPDAGAENSDDKLLETNSSGKIACGSDAAQRDVCKRTEPETDTHVSRVRKEVGESDDFFYAELPCGSRLLHVQNVTEDGKGKHPLHFGRAVAAAALGRPDLVDWKVCVPDEKVEIEKAERVRERIQEFLPALE